MCTAIQVLAIRCMDEDAVLKWTVSERFKVKKVRGGL